MTITHHLDGATLMSFAAGSLPTALAAVAAAHVRYAATADASSPCWKYRRGAGVGPCAGDLGSVASRAGARASPQPCRCPAARGELPPPLAGLLGGGLDNVRWRWIGPGLWHRPLRIRGAGSLQLIKAVPGASVPEHTHGGSELTLVLRGAFIDARASMRPGDVADLDEDVEHTPVADAEAGCICVIANEQPDAVPRPARAPDCSPGTDSERDPLEPAALSRHIRASAPASSQTAQYRRRSRAQHPSISCAFLQREG